MSGESVGVVQLDLEINSDIDGNIQEEASKLAERIQKQVDSMSTDMFKSLRECITASLDRMNESIKVCFDRTKSEMLNFVQQMGEIVGRISGIQMPYEQATDESAPQTPSSKSNSARAPPSFHIQNPKVKFDSQFDTEMFQQKYAELESMMDMLDNQILVKQTERKSLLKSYKPNMNTKAESALDKQIADLDVQIAKLQDIASRTNITLSAMDRKMKSAGNSTDKTTGRFSKMKSTLSGLGSGTFQKFKSSLSSLKGKFIDVAKSGINRFSNGMKSAGKHALSFSKKMLGLESSSKKASGSMGGAHRGIGQLIKSFTIFSLIFPLVSRGIMALGQNLMSVLKTNTTFSNSLNQIRSNLATAFTPIFQAVMPALNALMSGLATVTGYIAAFISSIFGKSYSATKQATAGIYGAKEAMGAYGDSAKDTANKINSLGIDELNIMNSQDVSGSSGGGGGSDAPVYTPSDVDEGIVDTWVQKLKDLWKNGDYAGVGKLIGEQINKAVVSFTKFISWDRIGKSITKFTKGFCELFNGLIKSINWNNIGKLFGTGINTVAKALRQLLEGISWESIGKAFADGLNGLVYMVDWDNLGATIGSYFQARINALYGFVKNADWARIGKALADGLMGMINKINWSTLADTLGTGISGFISSAHNFINNIDWRGLGYKIASSINTFFKKINWKDFGMTVSDAVLGILDMLCNAVKEIDWGALGHDISDAILSVDWWGIITGLGDLLVRLILGLGDTLLTAFVDIAQAMWDGFCKGISEFFSDPGAFIKEKIVDPFVSWIKSLFGIRSPSTVMAEIGKFLIEGLMEGIKNFIPNLLKNVGEWLGGIVDVVGNVCSDVAENVHSAWDGICTSIGDFVDSISGKVSGGFRNTRVNATKETKRLKDGVIGDFSAMHSDLSEMPKKLQNIGGNMFLKMKEGINAHIGGIKSAISIGISNATSVLRSLKDDAVVWGKDMMTGLKSGIDGTVKKVADAAKSAAQGIASYLHFSRPDIGPLRDYETWMPDMVDGLTKTLNSSSPKLIGNVRTIAQKISGAMNLQPDIAFAGHRAYDQSYLSGNNHIETRTEDMTGREIIYLLQRIIAILEEMDSSGFDIDVFLKALKNRSTRMGIEIMK